MEKSKFSIILFAGTALACFAISAYAVPPKVTRTIPKNGDQNVDPGLRNIRIEFDQNMNQGGMSVCGSGPSFPKTAGKPKWISKKTLVMRVKLQPNHEYELSVNSQSYKNFKNVQGESAVVYPIKFKTTTAGEKSSTSTKSPSLLLQEGIYAEETEGDLEKAIGLYKQVLEKYKQVERLAARATYQLGMCHLKKGENEKAAEYFQDVVDYYPKQKTLVKKADEQLKKVKPETKESIFEQIDYQVTRFLGEKFGETAIEAGQQHLLVNSHIYYVDRDGFRYRGGMNAFYNWTGRTITQKVRFGGTSYQNQTHYGVDGNKLNTEIVPDKTRPNHWQIYWTPDEPLAPEESLYYGWSMNNKRKASKLPGDVYSLTMQNQFGSPVIETFFLVLPKELKISQSNPPTESQELLNFNVHWWTKTVQQNENHVERIQLVKVDILTNGRVITTVNDFLKALIAGDTTEAMELVTASSAVAHQLDGISEIPNYKTMQIASVHADNEKAFAVTTDNGQDAVLTITLVKQRGLWMVEDIDMETSEKAKTDIQEFLKNNPAARRLENSDTEKLEDLIRDIYRADVPRFEALNKIIKIGEPAVGQLIIEMEKSSNWQVPQALGAIKDKRAVGPLIQKLKKSKFSPMNVVIAEALDNITGKNFGKDSTKWQQWWDVNKELYTPANTIKNFMAAALKLDAAKAMTFVAPDSHDYEDIKEIFENSEHPFNIMFRKLDASKSVKIIETKIKDTMCSAVWRVTFKEEFTIEGKTFKIGETFDLDGNLHKYGDKWMITGI